MSTEKTSEHSWLLSEMRNSGCDQMNSAADLIEDSKMMIGLLTASVESLGTLEVLRHMHKIAGGPFGTLNPIQRQEIEKRIVTNLASDDSELAYKARVELSGLQARLNELRLALASKVNTEIERLRSIPAHT